MRIDPTATLDMVGGVMANGIQGAEDLVGLGMMRVGQTRDAITI